MNNLRVRRIRPRTFGKDALAFCLDADKDIIYIIWKGLQITRQFIRSDSCQSENETIIEHKFLDSLITSAASIISFDYVVEFNSVLISINDGRLLRIGVENNDIYDKIYNHNYQIESVKVSPDQELIALADSEGNILLMDISDFQVIESSNVIHNDLSAHQPVGVGWGSKETQFFGLDGRPAKESQLSTDVMPKNEESQFKANLEACETFQSSTHIEKGSITVDWRPDGQYLVTLSLHKDEGKHKIKVWNRALALQYVSDMLIDMVNGHMSWTPNNYFLCGLQQRVGMKEIILFEKNGMVRFRIPLPTNLANMYVSNISWSTDSQILAVMGIKFDISQDECVHKKSILMLYTTSNCRYYLKHSRYLEGHGNYSMRWSSNDLSRIHLLSDDGTYYEIQSNQGVDFSHDKDTVFVVDGTKLLITPTQITSIPPPLSAIRLEFTQLIQSICVDKHNATRFLVLTIDGQLILFNEHMMPARNESDDISVEIVNKVAGESLVSLTKGHYQRIRLEDAQTYDIFEFLAMMDFLCTRATKDGALIHKLLIRGDIATISPVTSITGSQISQILCQKYLTMGRPRIILFDGRIYSVNTDDGSINLETHLGPYNYSPVPSIHAELKSEFIASLSQELTLTFGPVVVSSRNCTSFRINDHFLVYTTNADTLNIVTISKLLSEDPTNLNHWSQPIEKGATLVVLGSKDSRVVLQMPRGNIEIMYPRLLLIFRVEQLMSQLKYIEAVELARKHRLNMNFLADCILCSRFQEEEKSQRLRLFVDQLIQCPESSLILFLHELDQESTLSNRYNYLFNDIPYFATAYALDTTNLNRIQAFCNPIREKLLPSDNRAIMSYVKEARYGDALLSLKSNLTDKAALDSSIRFLTYYIPIVDLYHEAIGIYDTDIALSVAVKSSMDPKEYLPVLENFDRIPWPKLREYNMNLYIERFDEALRSLFDYLDENSSRIDDFRDEILKLIDNRHLYSFVYLLIIAKIDLGHNSNIASLKSLLDSVSSMHGEYLLSKRYFIQAGIMYSTALEYNPTNLQCFKFGIQCFELADRWDLALPILAKCKIQNEPVISDTINKICSNLCEKGKVLEAQILNLWSSSNRELKSSLPISSYTNMGLRGYYFIDLLSNHSHSSSEMIRKELTDSINSYCSMLTNETELANTNLSRLKELIDEYMFKRSQQQPQTLEYGDTLSTLDGSELSSVGSLSKGHPAKSGSIKTRNTAKTSKSVRHMRKRNNYKRGSRYEDLGLVYTLKNFIENRNERHIDGTNLIAAIHEFASQTSTLLNTTERVRELMKLSYQVANEIIDHLWPMNLEDTNTHSLYTRFEAAYLSNKAELDVLDYKVLVRPQKIPEPDYLQF